MAIQRYRRSNMVKGGKNYGTAQGAAAIYYAVKNGAISTDALFLKSSQRLDIIAGKFYGDASCRNGRSCRICSEGWS